MKVVVTGGAGYISSIFVRYLLREDLSIISIDNLSRGSYQYFKNLNSKESKNLKLIVGDIRENEILE